MSLKIVFQAIPIILLLLLVIAIAIPACASNPDSAGRVQEYKAALSSKPGAEGENPEAIAAFGKFIQNIHDKSYIEENTAKVYAPGAYLNDTLVTHHGPEEIKAYFLMTADTMETYEVTIDDTASSGAEHYVRWTMNFSAPKLNGGKPVISTGMSHVRLNAAGQIIMHQDFWDSGTNIYGQLPILGGAIESIRRRFE
ncbi:MAG: nuclear transport factor 2 family protein [Luteolibacter sp.]